MREIKFRAWDMKKKQMLTIFDSSVGSDWYLPSWKENYKVMQYTGLKDKNGTEIYEGDIVKHMQYEEYGKLSERTGGVTISPISGVMVGMDCIGREIEVIGNIYENTELLEE